MNSTPRRLTLAIGIAAVLGLAGCKTMPPMPGQQGQPTSGGPSSPTSGPSSPMPSPSTPGPSSPMPSPTSTPSSMPSLPSTTPSQPSVAMPSPSSGKPGDSSDKQGGGEKGDAGKAGTQSADREKAGEDLQKAGERVASAGGAVGDLATPRFPDATSQPGNDEPDPLIPDSESTKPSDTVMADEGQSAPAGGDESASTAAAGGEPASAPDESESAGDESTPAGDDSAETTSVEATAASEDPLDAEIRAAQEALEKAGIKLQEAGEAIRTAQTDEELARAQDLLSQARIIVIVTTQDLMDAKDVLGDATPEQSQVFDDAEQALNDATIAIVIATDSLLGLPDLASLPTSAGLPDTRESGTLDDELEHSLIIFDGQINQARQAVLEPTAPPSSTGTEQPATVATNRTGVPSPGEQPESPAEPRGPSSGANSQGSSPMESNKQDDQLAMSVPEGVGSGQGDDIVAQQLREAAMAETDPKLREKLWEEYKRYKSGM